MDWKNAAGLDFARPTGVDSAGNKTTEFWVKDDNGGEKKVSIPELFMLLSFKLSDNGKGKIKAQTEKMQTNNAVVNELNEKIANLSALQAYVKSDQSERKSLADLIGESLGDKYKNVKREADTAQRNRDSAKKDFDDEAKHWGNRGGKTKWGSVVSVESALTWDRHVVIRKFVEADVIKVDKHGNLKYPRNFVNNLDRMREDWGNYKKHSTTLKQKENEMYLLTKDPIKKAFDGLEHFMTEATKRDGDGELLRDGNGQLKLDGGPINLLENFNAVTHGQMINGVKVIDDVEINAADLDALITHLKGKIESYNSQSQLDMIDLQKYTSENNRYFDMASNMLSKGTQSMQSIIGNIRA